MIPNMSGHCWRILLEWKEGQTVKDTFLDRASVYRTVKAMKGLIEIKDGVLCLGDVSEIIKACGDFVTACGKNATTCGKNATAEPALLADVAKTPQPESVYINNTHKKTLIYEPGTFPAGAAPPDEKGMPRNFSQVVERMKELKHASPEGAATEFCMYYSSVGWHRGKTKITNWWLVAATWRHSTTMTSNGQPQMSVGPVYRADQERYK